MARGILIFGSAGAGKRTLGDAVARELGFAHINTDDLFWRTGMKYPYTLMLPREDRKVRLVDAIWPQKNFVLSGNLDTISEHFEPMFDLVVYLTPNTHIRLERLQAREYEKFGDRVCEGGDLFPCTSASLTWRRATIPTAPPTPTRMPNGRRRLIVLC